MRTRLQYAAFGVIATLLGMAAGHLVASLLQPDSSPVLAVSSSIIDLTPTPVKEWAISNFGTKDKPILLGSVMVFVLVFAAVAGLLTKKRRELGIAMLVLLVAVAAAAVLTRPAVRALDVLPVLATLAAGVATLWYLDRLARRAAAQPTETTGTETTGTGGASRRGVLIAMGALTAVAGVLGGAGRLIIGVRSRAEDIALPAPTNDLGTLPTGLEKKYPAITPLRIDNADFYRVDTRPPGDTPIVDSASWTLTVDGDVENELEISFDDLLDMPMVERDITLTCVSNSVGGKYVGAARWQGVLLKDVLDMAGVGDKADQILSTDFDGMTISTPLDLATDGRDAMIVVGMNGEPLPRAHGFPVRLIIPGLYGFISATKWLTKITLTTYADREAYWTKKKWDTDAPIKPSTRIDTPRALSTVSGAEVIVGGVSWAQNDQGVTRVQVQVDGAGWQDAELGPDVGDVYWRQWYWRWTDPKPGQVTLKARVVDGNGDVQTDVRAEPFPGGASGIHSIFVTVE